MTSPVVLFAAATSAGVGRGHLNRCIAISDALQKTGVPTALYDPGADGMTDLASLLPEGLPFLRSQQEAEQFLAGAERSVVFLDDYRYRKGPPDIAGSAGVRAVAMLDDFNETPPDIGMLFRLTRSGTSESAGDRPLVLAGEHLAPMRTAFFQARRLRKPDGTLLICLGASSAGLSATGQILGLLERLGWQQPVSLAVSLPQDEARQMERRYPGLNLRVHAGLTDLSPLMACAERAICSPSVTAYELATLGVPMLAVQIADNQARLAEHLEATGAARRFEAGDLTSSGFETDLQNFLLSEPGAGGCPGLRCDGLGARRIARHLRQVIENMPEPEMRLEIATMQDLEPLFRLQCLPEVRAHARNPEPPALAGHTNWFTAMLADPARELFIMFAGQAMAGFVRIDRQLDGGGRRPDQYEISIAVDPAFWGRGMARQALNYLFDLLPDDVFIAHVLPENDRSHSLFRATGFVWRDGRYERPPAVINMKSGLEPVS
ncbi:MAG: bifunctional UDP-2,4-diacetamido-2,4,6-trideoxy-beta-L-altropyranose hydrolase/GNAT family N-acetyltransferase [Rhodospirillales bacterium]